MDFRFETTDLALHDGEPRIADVKLADVLGFKNRRNIRELISRNASELEGYGTLPCRTASSTGGNGAQRDVSEYLLNEGQALVICSLSRTDMAAQVRRALIDVFMAWRKGAVPQGATPVQASAHRIRAAKLRFAEAATALDALGVDVPAINLSAVLAFGRAVLR